LPDRFIEHGERNELLADCGLDAASVIRRLEQDWLKKLTDQVLQGVEP
jgi:deoxyxylulose-5-phosphate synthase